MQDPKVVEIRGCDFRFKTVECLQQNWALMDDDSVAEGCIVFYFGDTSGVFDRLRFASRQEA